MGEGKNLVGVDIGTSSVKACQIREGRRGPVLVRLGYAPLRPQTVVDGQVMDAATVVEALQRAFRDAGIRQRQIALSVSGHSVIIRKISVPMMTLAELEEQIHWEAEQHIPFDIKDVQVDYQVLRRHPEKGQMDLLLVAAKRDQIEEYAQLARDAKLKPVVCDIDAFTVQNLFEVTRGLPSDRTIVLLNVGAALTSVNIVSKGVSAFTREIANGGNAITEEIQKQLGVSFDQAEAYKCHGLAEGSELSPTVRRQVEQIVEAVADSIAAEIQRSLDFFMATSGEAEISHIYLTGGTANLPPLAAAVSRRARVPAELWMPTERIVPELREPDRQVLRAHATQLAVALGLALRRSKEVRQ